MIVAGCYYRTTCVVTRPALCRLRLDTRLLIYAHLFTLITHTVVATLDSAGCCVEPAFALRLQLTTTRLRSTPVTHTLPVTYYYRCGSINRTVTRLPCCRRIRTVAEPPVTTFTPFVTDAITFVGAVADGYAAMPLVIWLIVVAVPFPFGDLHYTIYRLDGCYVVQTGIRLRVRWTVVIAIRWLRIYLPVPGHDYTAVTLPTPTRLPDSVPGWLFTVDCRSRTPFGCCSVAVAIYVVTHCPGWTVPHVATRCRSLTTTTFAVTPLRYLRLPTYYLLQRFTGC